MTSVQTPTSLLLDAPLTQWGINVSWAKYISGLLQNEEAIFTDENDQLDLFLELLWTGRLGMQLPVGSINLIAQSSLIPTEWLECNGQAVSRTTYNALFSALGTVYGSGNGSTTFNVPDTRGRVVMGQGTSDLGTSRTLATKVGSDTHTLTLPQIPFHTHAISSRAQSGSIYPTFGAGGTPVTIQGSTESAGGGLSHNNVQPSLVMCYMIKAR